MESILGIIFSAENVRMLVLLVFGFSCYIRFKTLFGNDIARLDAKIDVLTFQVNAKIEALTFVLEKNGSLKKEDKEYIDSRSKRQ